VTKLEISGITCANCARHVTDAIQARRRPQRKPGFAPKQQRRCAWNSGAEEIFSPLFQAVKKWPATSEGNPNRFLRRHASPQNIGKSAYGLELSSRHFDDR